MKKKLIVALSVSICLCSFFSADMQSKAASSEYSIDQEFSKKKIAIQTVDEGYDFSNDCYFYNDSMFYSVCKYNESDTEIPTADIKIYQANTDGSGANAIFSQRVDGDAAQIELVTEKYIMVLFGYGYWGDALLIDRTTGQGSRVEAFARCSFSDNAYKKGIYNTAHVNEYYPMIRSHSDVSPQKAIIFNGKNAKKTTIAAKCWSARILNKKLYYVFEKKDGFYLGCCTYKGKDKKTIQKIDTPKDSTVLVYIKSINKNRVVLAASGSDGNETIKISLK